MICRLIVIFALVLGVIVLPAQENYDKELEKESDAHIRAELGVNDVTTPSIQQILKDLGSFQPIPFSIIANNDREAVFDNRLQTSLHFGTLVADGFMLTIAERSKDVQDIGRALIRQSRALGVGERLTKRSKSLLELSDKGDWVGMREELVKTQTDVEQSMLDMRDEEMAHMISLGGWMRGFQLAANSCVESYSPERATILVRPEIIDYYIDRLETLHPRLKKTELIIALTAKLKELRILTSATPPPREDDVKKMRDLANQLVTLALSPVDSEGNILTKQPIKG